MAEPGVPAVATLATVVVVVIVVVVGTAEVGTTGVAVATSAGFTVVTTYGVVVAANTLVGVSDDGVGVNAGAAVLVGDSMRPGMELWSIDTFSITTIIARPTMPNAAAKPTSKRISSLPSLVRAKGLQDTPEYLRLPPK